MGPGKMSLTLVIPSVILDKDDRVQTVRTNLPDDVLAKSLSAKSCFGSEGVRRWKLVSDSYLMQQ